MKLAWIPVLVSVTAIGCQIPVPTREPLDPIDPRPRVLMQELARTAAERQALRGALRLSLDAKDLHLRRPQRLAIRRPAELRVEVLGLFGQIAAVVVTDGETYQSLDSQGEFESGAVSEDLLWRIARVALRPGEAVDVLLGVPLPRPGSSFSGAFVDSHGTLSLDFRDARGVLRERVAFDLAGQLSEFVRFEDRERIAWQAKFADYREVSGSPFAFDVRLTFPEVDATASLQFDHATLDPELSDSLFVLRAHDPAVAQ